MKKELVEIGMLVAVNDLPDGQVYRVAAKEGNNLWRLTYENAGGKIIDGGITDYSILQRPTKAQLLNWQKETGRIPADDKPWTPEEIMRSVS